ncbi:hypothetical protein ACQFG6_005179 [Klebsiella michiganensis]|nr:hypothetical protein [Citrobacter freundii]HBV3767073.1 hypothetical protein [Klebsiella pneumoniae]
MTKSTITRDQLRALAVKKVESLKFAITQSAFTNIRRGLEEELQLAEFALAAIDAEPVAWRYRVAEESTRSNWMFTEEEWRTKESISFESEPLCVAPYTSMFKKPTEKSAFLQHAEKLAADAKELAERVQRNDVTALTTCEEHRQLRDLVMMVKVLCRTIRKYNPESQKAANFTAYLQKEGLISASDCLRDSARQDTDSEDSRG